MLSYNFVAQLRTIIILTFSLLMMVTPAFANEKLATGKFVVSLYASESQKSWVARAIEQNIYNDLAGYARVIPVQKSELEHKQCIAGDIDCVLALYKSIQVDALLTGEVDESSIDFKVYNVQKKSLVKTGSISIGGGTNLLQLRMDAFGAFKPFLAKGGILERQQFSAKPEPSEGGIEKQLYQHEFDQINLSLLVSLAIASWLPYIFSIFGKPLLHHRRTKILLSWFFPFQILSLTLLGVFYIFAPKVSENIIEVLEHSQWLLLILAGLVWGYFIILNLRIIHPHPQGLERVGQRNLLPLLRAYLLTFSVKLIILVSIYLAVFYLVSQLFELTFSLVALLLLPILGLYILYWVGLVLEVLAMSLDIRFSLEDKGQQVVWSKKLHKYFMSYLKRSGVSLNEKRLNDFMFLAGKDEGVYCYGGFLSRPRIVVGVNLIKEALGDNSDKIKPYLRENIDQSRIYQFIPNVFPTSHEIKKRFGIRRKRANVLDFDPLFLYPLNKQDDGFALGQDSIMKGVVMPKFEGKEDLPSLMSDNLDDMSIVDALMQEDSVRSDPYDEEAEIDDSDENDKDFLFGILLHKFGELLRHDQIFSTFYLYFSSNKKKSEINYRFPLGRYFARVADTFVVLNFGLFHLMQYLHMCATGQKSYLTKRASSNILLESQNIVLLETREATEERRERINHCDHFDRLVWLSNFCDNTISVKKNTFLRKGIKASLVVLGGYLVVVTLFDAYSYQYEYQLIIENERREITEMMQAAQNQQGKENDNRR